MVQSSYKSVKYVSFFAYSLEVFLILSSFHLITCVIPFLKQTDDRIMGDQGGVVRWTPTVEFPVLTIFIRTEYCSPLCV